MLFTSVKAAIREHGANGSRLIAEARKDLISERSRISALISSQMDALLSPMTMKVHMGKEAATVNYRGTPDGSSRADVFYEAKRLVEATGEHNVLPSSWDDNADTTAFLAKLVRLTDGMTSLKDGPDIDGIISVIEREFETRSYVAVQGFIGR